MPFLPISKEDLVNQNIQQPDFVFVFGDAYVDHPSFGPAIISRVLEAAGYTVAMIPQPNWKKEESITVFGAPRLGFLVSGGNMDSMVNHYYVSKKRRETDAYSPGGVMGKRPDRATVAYSNLIRRVYKQVPIIIGGIEASLRRTAHYDYWSDSFKRSILLDSQADLLSYGMGEKSIVEIADALASGMNVQDITFIAGTVFKTKDPSFLFESVILPSYDQMKMDPTLYAESYHTQSIHTDAVYGKCLVEEYERQFVVVNPPATPLSQAEMDAVYDLPYMRREHPIYQSLGGIPAITEIKFSLLSSRGCFGSCSFCALTFHQGRVIQARSHESIVKEAIAMTKEPDFKGYIHDVGGPTANFRHPSCDKQLSHGVCKDKQCLWPSPCKNLDVSHLDYLQLLQKLRAIPGVKKVFIRSGIRFDYLLLDADDSFFRELIQHHISGQLKVAPEHVSDKVLAIMGKPGNHVYQRFVKKYEALNKEYDKNQFMVPYLMSSHPGSTLKEAIELAEYLRDIGYMPQQVQDFYPTPSTISTVIYYTGIHPVTKEKVYVCKNPHEKAMQRALIQYRNPKNRALVEEALVLAGRTDLIGYDAKCLIRPLREGARQRTDTKDMRRVDKRGDDKRGEDKRGKENTRQGNIRKNNHKTTSDYKTAGSRKTANDRRTESDYKTTGNRKTTNNHRAASASVSGNMKKAEEKVGKTTNMKKNNHKKK